MSTIASDSPPGSAPDNRAPKRDLLKRLILLTVALLIVLAAVAYWLVTGRYSISTEDAYVGGNVVMVTAQVSGVVTAIEADDTDHVRAGQTVIRIDDTDARLALDRAQAQLALVVREVRSRYASAETARANVEVREVALARAAADALQMVRQQWKSSRAAIDRVSLDRNPAVLAAAAQVRDAYVDLGRTVVPAPVAGIVTRRHV